MKNALIIILSLVLFSCKTTEKKKADKATKDTMLTVIELRTGHNSGFTQPVNKVITSQEELSEVWTVLFANYLKKEAAPEIDFEHNVLILVAAGEKNSGGYSIKVNQAVSKSDKTYVSVLNIGPGKNCVVTEAITYPFQLVQVKKTGQAITFDTMEKLIDCDSE